MTRPVFAEPAAITRFRRKIGWRPAYWWQVPLVVQLVAMLAFSTYQYDRFALTHDFSLYWQAVYLIAHGHLNPYASMDRFPFVDNHFELIMWPIALLYWLWPHASLLLYVQDGALVGTEWIAWQWALSLMQSRGLPVHRMLRSTVILLLVLNPWVFWTAATDFHSESLAALTVMAAAYALYRRNSSGIVLWSILSLACGDVAAVTLGAVGISGLFRQRYRAGVLILGMSIAWLGVISAVGGNRGSILILIYGYLLSRHYPGQQMSAIQLVQSLIARPGIALRMLWHHRLNLYANVAPGGLVGVFSLWAFPLFLATVVIANLSSGYLFGVPGFQNVLYYGFGVVGTVEVLLWLWPKLRREHWRMGLLSLIAVNSVAWALVWIPQIPSHWVRVPAATARSLAYAKSLIPAGAEVIAPQGLMGRFGDRQWLYNMGGHAVYRYPMHTGTTYLVMAPYAGIHFTSIQTQATWLTALSRDPRATLVYADHGMYLWKVIRRSQLFLTLPYKRDYLPAWPFQPTGGNQVVGGPPRHWYIASKNRGPGFVLNRDYWRERPGVYTGSVTLSSWGTASLQVWDATTGTLLAQHEVPTTRGVPTAYQIPAIYRHAGPARIFAGWGLWRIVPAQGLSNQLEIRVYAHPASMVDVYAVGLTRRASAP